METRLATLYKMSDYLELLKFLIRLANDIRAINLKQYVALESLLREIGRMLGGWIKSVTH